MKKSFYYIVTSILTILLLVFCWQIYWLRGLYTSLEEEQKRGIIKQWEAADQLDLLYRTDILEEKTKKRNYEKVISISGKTDEQGKIAFEKEERLVDRSKETNDTTIVKNDVRLDEIYSISDHLIKSINEAMHDAVDPAEPIRLQHIDSIFRQKLIYQNIPVAHYYTELFDTKNDSIIDTSITDPVTNKAPESPTIIYPFGTEGHYCYRIYMEPLTKTILIRMGGILITTLLIILVLVFAFWYLIQTVFNQKTLEEMKDDFTNNMTHELKTPIAVAYSATDALLNFDLSKDEEKRRKYLTICKEQLTRLSHLVEQILSMSMEQHKSFELHPEEVTIKAVINKLVEQHKLKARKPVVIEVEYQMSDPVVYADKTHLNNMLSNLIDNAIKYSGQDAKIIIKIVRNETLFRFSITDNGLGIPTDKQTHLFEKFYRVPRGNLHNVKGYGLGLYYVKIMAEKQGGSISVKSSPEKGSTFILQIPQQKRT